MPSFKRAHLPDRLPLLPALIFFAAAVFSPSVAWAAPASVRVEVIDKTPSVHMTVPGPGLISSGSSVRKEIDDLRWQEVRPVALGLQVGRMTFPVNRLTIAPRESGLIYLNGAKYRGAMTIVRLSSEEIQVINAIPLEEYLKGVVPSESDHRWPMETLKAQAIIARTFTLLQLADRAGHEYDVTKKWPQLYGGYRSERERGILAVTSTEGLVLIDEGKLLNTYYFTVCGGTTEDGPAVFPKATQPALKSVRCNHCRRAAHYHWTLRMNAQEIGEALARGSVQVGSLTGIALGPRNRSGRLTALTFKGTEDSTSLPAVRWRSLAGPNKLRSTRFSVQRKGEDWIFEGRGWGHGVGLCQWGAAGLGRQRYTAEQILEYYYPGARVIRWSSL
ncbi:MAG: SpoIID/LytB domain-containing protein [Candidatus Omnitrophica bacterium]|nr:SpoIID/LytB domain-containing protein [Candidatus Omnitrophota bacterium]